MKLKKRISKKFRRGSILAFVLVIGLCLALLGVGMLQMGFGSRLNSHLSVNAITAREAADAGIAKALSEMNLNFDPSSPPPNLGIVITETLDNSNAVYNYRIDLHPNGVDYLITSTGFSNRGQRVVYAVTDLLNDQRYGIVVSETITLRQGTLIDGYDSIIGYDKDNPLFVRIGTNSITEDALELKNNVVITGDVLVGVGGDPDAVINMLGSPGPSMNARYAMREPYEWVTKIPPVGLPPGVPINFVEDPLFPQYPGGVATIKQSGVYDSIIIGQRQGLRIESDAVPKQPIALLITGDLNLGQGAELLVEGSPGLPGTWTPTTIFLNGNLDGSNSNGINNATQKPINFYLYGTGTDQTWIIKNGTDFYGVYNGRFADIYISAKGQIFGAIAGRNFELDVASGGDPSIAYGVHYDLDLAPKIGTDIGYVIKSWWEEKIE